MALPSPLHSPLQSLSDNARWLYPLAVFVAALVLGNLFGLGLGLLIVAGGVLGASIWLIWSSLQGLGSDAPITLEEAISLGAPSAEEEQKRAVLRALKDLEYERAVGKISDDDYASLAEHYRGEAKRLLRAVDRDLSPERERAERLLAERLAAASAKAPAKRRAKAAVTAGAGADADERAEAERAEAERAEAERAEPADDDEARLADEGASAEAGAQAEASAEAKTASAAKRPSSDIVH